jgi:ferredoxin
VGKKLRERLPDAELLPLVQLARQDEILLDGCVGFLFPQYYLGMPEIAYRTLQRADLSRCKYLFGLTTCGSFPFTVTGGAQRMREALVGVESGPSARTLDAFFYVWMPGNHLPGNGAYPGWVIKAQLGLARRRIARIARQVTARAARVELRNRWLANYAARAYAEWIDEQAKWDHAFRVEPECNGCGTCVRVCRVDNLRLENRHPAWLGHCQQCLACIHLCPQQAIEYGPKTAGRTRYRHPEIRLGEIAEQNM